MKIRNNFVSNSSSSSFIVTFPEQIKNKETLLKYLDIDWYNSLNANELYFNEKYPLEDVVESVYWQLQQEQVQDCDADELCDELLKDYCTWDLTEFFENRNISLRELKNKSLKEIVSEQIKSNTYSLVFSDEHGSFGSDMEHNIAPKIFGQYLVERISNH